MLADTDSRNVSCRIQIQIVKNVTISPDNRYFAEYPCIPCGNKMCQTVANLYDCALKFTNLNQACCEKQLN